MKEYKKRIADQILADKLDAMGAVLIEGPKCCGKTTLACQQAGSILYMADPSIATAALGLGPEDLINEAWSRRRNSDHLAETVTGVKASRTKGFSEVLRSGVGFSKTQIEADNNQRNSAWTEIYYYI